MPDPTAPAPTAPVPNAPAAPTVPTLEGTAAQLAARLRAHAGLPPQPKGGQPDPKAAPSSAATPAGTPTAPSTTEPTSPEKPEEKPPEGKKSDGLLALELVREQKARAAAEKKAAELEARLKTGEPESAALATARAKWKEAKFVEAIRDAFGTGAFSDEMLVQLAAHKPEPEQLTEEQLTEKIRQQLKAEMKAEEESRAAQLAELREAAIVEVGGTLTKSPEKWPTVWRFGVSGEKVGEVMDANRGATPEQIFDLLEKEYRGNVEGLPYWQRTEAAAAPAEPPPPAAPRSFGTESRRGPVPSTEAPKPQTAEERWEARRKADAEWRAKTFGARN